MLCKILRYQPFSKENAIYAQKARNVFQSKGPILKPADNVLDSKLDSMVADEGYGTLVKTDNIAADEGCANLS